MPPEWPSGSGEPKAQVFAGGGGEWGMACRRPRGGVDPDPGCSDRLQGTGQVPPPLGGSEWGGKAEEASKAAAPSWDGL